MMDKILDQLQTIAAISLRFGQTLRATEHPDGTRESDTTHTTMLQLACLTVAPLAGLDPVKCAMYALVHDLPESDPECQDTCTARALTPEQQAAKAAREAAATERLTALLGGDSPIIVLLAEYEAQSTPEARFVHYLDKITPKLTHLANDGRALRSIGMTLADMLDSHAVQGAALQRRHPDQTFMHELFACVVSRCDTQLADKIP
jgi:5'-deoxynucleotidase YfbR-like HD superfamily hydrolase